MQMPSEKQVRAQGGMPGVSLSASFFSILYYTNGILWVLSRVHVSYGISSLTTEEARMRSRSWHLERETESHVLPFDDNGSK